ncbi:unnamed protein product [Hyaloperonospora brassicae]|uniref:Uncharacterized protein n=1 Tax=Hyaloperonospora brassicae TaxID=162125 RepID=A0AAV0TA59_HYABA|nr:unnamed protein product [Hyaloperonospora brassicae]
MPEWGVELRGIRATAAAVRCRHDLTQTEVDTFIKHIDHDDVLLAYAAKEELRKVLVDGGIVETQCVTRVITALSTTPATGWGREASGFRFQLLRQLLTVQTVELLGEDDRDNQSECGLAFPYRQAVAATIRQVGAMVRSVFLPADGSGDGLEVARATAAPNSVQYEALVLMSDIVKRVCHLESTDHFRVALGKVVIALVDDVCMAMDYASQPAFVSCAVLKLLGDFQALATSWLGLEQEDDGGKRDASGLEAVYAQWLETCLAWSVQSACTSTALQLLHADESQTVSGQTSFVASSGRYPFLQQWLLCVSRVGAAWMEESLRRRCVDAETWRLPAAKNALHCLSEQQVSRKQVWTVLVEQDDTMVEVLQNLTRMTTCASHPVLAQSYPSVATYLAAEFDPDLLFADLVETLGWDHSVLLDLLVSDETQMLRYIVQYLRRLNTQWRTSKQKLQACQQLEGVMSVLIRLRLDINRLAAADLFPYRAGPLTRRLVAIEQLYEETK